MEQEAERLAQLEHVGQRRGADEYDQADEWGGRGRGKRTCECECEFELSGGRRVLRPLLYLWDGRLTSPVELGMADDAGGLASAIVFKCDGGVRYIAGVRLNHWTAEAIVRS